MFRVGLHLGDLIVEGTTMSPEMAPNVAARLETEASPGGIVVSVAVRDAVAGRVKPGSRTWGTLALKNIERPVRAFRVAWEAADWKTARSVVFDPLSAAGPPYAPRQAIDRRAALPEHERRSGAGIFRGWHRRGHHYGIGPASVRCSSSPATHSSIYKGRRSTFVWSAANSASDIYCEGSVRKAGERATHHRTIDRSGERGTNLRAERYEGELDDVFTLQDRITKSGCRCHRTQHRTGGNRTRSTQDQKSGCL